MKEASVEDRQVDPRMTGATAVIVRKGSPETPTRQVQATIEIVGDEIDRYLLARLTRESPRLHIAAARRNEVGHGKRAADLVADLQFSSIGV